MKKIIRKASIAAVILMVSTSVLGCASSEVSETVEVNEVVEVETAASETTSEVIEDNDQGDEAPADRQQGAPGLDENGNEVGPAEDVYTFDDAPIEIMREEVTSLELPSGETHWYEVVYLPEGGVNWVQAKNLAEQAGGYLVSLHSDEENEFVFDLIEDEKYWFTWEETNVCNGPFIGAFQPEGAEEPDGGWQWVSGEDWTYQAWAVDNMPGDEDPRPNDQPNDATGNQNVGAYGEITIPVSTWGDFPRKISSYGDENTAKVYGFVIEYNEEPVI